MRGRAGGSARSKKIPTAGVPTLSVDKNCGKLRANGSGTCACAWVRRCSSVRSNGPLRKNRLPCSRRWKTSLTSMAPGSGLRHSDEPRGGSVPMPSPMPAGWKTPLSSGSQPELRAKYVKRMLLLKRGRLSGLPDRLSALCEAQNTVWRKAAKGDRARRVSAVRRLLPPPAPVPLERKPIQLGPIRWVDVAGRALRRSWITRLPPAICRGACTYGHVKGRFSSPSPTACRALASELPLARPARTQCLVGTTATACHRSFRSRSPRRQRAREESATERNDFNALSSPSE
jgi:hypothetical protein